LNVPTTVNSHISVSQVKQHHKLHPCEVDEPLNFFLRQIAPWCDDKVTVEP
jgi:hypothetical protein